MLFHSFGHVVTSWGALLAELHYLGTPLFVYLDGAGSCFSILASCDAVIAWVQLAELRYLYTLMDLVLVSLFLLLAS